ncbi:CPBP family intramembrane glutamic endopeptidase [Micromonospora sonneratiae]|uniref:CPBP family intramembrane glutamic endopeptidase n=1 Tax=Micromonospora sonneratiae TaxID=1184706 RepID=A0ABW3YSH3_9ACTN
MAYLLSWAAWTPYILSATGLGILDFRFPAILGTTQFLGVLPGAYLGPITSAFVVTAIADGRPGLRRWVGRMLKWRISWRWYLSVLVGVPAALVITSVALFDGAVQLPPVTVLAAYLPVLLIQMFTTGVAEEPGWRDFATPRLQRRYNALVGTMILGPLWGIWHLPLFLSEWGGWPNTTWLTVGEFLAGAIGISVVMTWVFNRTGESLPVVMLLHVSINTFMSVAWAEMFPADANAESSARVVLLASVTAALVTLLATRGRLGDRPAEKRETPAVG